MDILQLIIDNTLKYPLLDVLDILLFSENEIALYWKKHIGSIWDAKNLYKWVRSQKLPANNSESTGNMLYKKL